MKSNGQNAGTHLSSNTSLARCFLVFSSVLTWERCYYIDFIFCEKTGQVFLAFFEENNEVAPVYDGLPHGSCLH
jgi:hypothetical protein